MDHATESTRAVFDSMLAVGMESLSVGQLTERLKELGYHICVADSFNYYNTYNRRPYKARAIGIVDDSTGHDFANIAANRDNLPALQKLRFNAAVLHRGRIWEL